MDHPNATPALPPNHFDTKPAVSANRLASATEEAKNHLDIEGAYFALYDKHADEHDADMLKRMHDHLSTLLIFVSISRGH